MQNEQSSLLRSKGLLIGVGIFIAVVLAGGYFVLAGNRAKPSPSPSPTADSGQALNAGEIKEVTVEGKEFSLSPSNLTLTKGEKVRIVFKNVGNMSHDFVIEGSNIRTRLVAPGGEEMLEFTPSESGTLTFYCSVGNHRVLGMEGEIEVE